MQRETYANQPLRFGRDSNGRPLVYRPNQVLVRVEEDAVAKLFGDLGDAIAVPNTPAQTEVPPTVHRRINDNWGLIKLPDDVEPKEVVELLRSLGYQAQLNHVYFAGALAASARANPNYAAPNYAASNYAAPNYAAPNYAAPNYAAPNYAAGHGARGHCCDHHQSEPETQPETPGITARKARRNPGPGLSAVDATDLQIHVLDVRPQTKQAPENDTNAWIDSVKQATANGQGVDTLSTLISKPGAILPEAIFLNDEINTPTTTAAYEDEKAKYALEPSSPALGANINSDKYLDPVTNHAAFIKGIIDRTMKPSAANGTYVTLHSVMGTLGEVDDASLARAMEHVADNNPPNDDQSIRIMNLSLSGYIDDDELVDCLAETVAQLQVNGWLIVASAGNNASCRPARPAALPGVVSVGAFGPCGPAWFSNYGWWVDACGPGVDIVSEFPDIGAGGLEIRDGISTNAFNTGFAIWSGTSFAAPYVAAIIARWITREAPQGDAKAKYASALAELITHDDGVRMHGYGAVISDEIIRIKTAVTTEDV